MRTAKEISELKRKSEKEEPTEKKGKSLALNGKAVFGRNGAPFLASGVSPDVKAAGMAFLRANASGEEQSNIGCGRHQQRKRLRTLAEVAWGGEVRDQMDLATLKLSKLDAWQGAKTITIDPASVNVSTFNTLHKAGGCDTGAEGQICSSTAVSKVLKILNDWVRARARSQMRPLACTSSGAHILGRM